MNIREAYSETKSSIADIYTSSEASSITELVFKEVFNIPNNQIIVNGDNDFEYEDKLNAIKDRLIKHEPVQQIIGYDYFMGLKIIVSKDVLIPRPETEELLEWVFANENSPRNVIDICSGSGCIAISLRKQYPNANLFALDVSRAAIELSKLSEAENFKSHTIDWIEIDILKDVPKIVLPDVVVCNPPYIKQSEQTSMEKHVLEFEPHIALFVYDEDPLLFYKRVVTMFPKNSGVKIYFEMNPLTAIDFQDWCEEENYSCEIAKDMSGLNRFSRITL